MEVRYSSSVENLLKICIWQMRILMRHRSEMLTQDSISEKMMWEFI